MYRLTAKIEITGAKSWRLEKVTEVEITRDTEKLTDECRLTLPKKIKWDGAAEIPVQRGDGVKVWLGYDGDLQLAFVGYVRDVGFKTPVVITCEDEMFKLKQMQAKKKAYKNVNLETLLKEQGLNYPLRVMGEQNLGQYRVTADTVASLLGHLQENGVRSFFRYEDGSPVLYCGVLFERDSRPSQVFATGVNIIDDQSLEQQKAENMRLRIKAVSLMPNNKKSGLKWATPTANTARSIPTTSRKPNSKRGRSRKSNVLNGTASRAVSRHSVTGWRTSWTPSASR